MQIIIRVSEKVTRVISPSKSFDGSVGKLVEHITGSDLSQGIKLWKSYEVSE
jgi:hypothetical protein